MTRRVANAAGAILAVAVLLTGSTAYAAVPCAVPETVVAPALPTKCLCPLGSGLAPNPLVVGGWLVNAPAQSGECNIAAPAVPGPAGPGVFTAVLPATQPKFAWELPQPIFHVPDTTSFPGTDYYVMGMKEVTQLPVAFPQPVTPAPANTQWLGLCSTAVGAFVPANPLAVPPVPAKCNIPWFTPVWGYAQDNGGAIPTLATYPSMSFLGKKGTPVKVKWMNELQSNNHLFCPYPQNSNWPCAIDRTLMGTLFTAADGGVIGPFGTKMQPDNAMVVHFHGGEVPPDSDGFAELWIGNGGPGGTAAAYAAQGGAIDPPLLTPLTPANGILSSLDYAVANRDPDRSLLASVYSNGPLLRPLSNSIFYNYPMVQDSATLWYHDHTLGKTRVNVAAGPAGYFYVQTPGVDDFPAGAYPGGSMYQPPPPPAIGGPLLPNPGDCSNGTVNPPTGILGNKCFDIPIVLQDRSFNMPRAATGVGACTDPACGGAFSTITATINYPNGLAQPVIPGVVNSLAPGVNPGVHPQWVPEYFGDSSVVNGVIWPKITVEPRPYRFRLLDGSNARCYTLNLKVPGALVQPQMIAIGSDQGYLPNATLLKSLDMCPGERYEVVIDFSTWAGQSIFLENTAAAPFPAGIKPTGNGPYAQMAQLLRFDVLPTIRAGSPPVVPYTLPKALKLVTPPAITLMPPTAPVGSREMVLNEVLDALTLQPLRVQIDGKRFEDMVTETPKRGTTEVWTVINTTVDAHPIHLHLVQFQVVGRQNFNASAYSKATGFGVPGNTVFTKQPIAGFLSGKPNPPLAYELGFKDTVIAYPGQITTVVATWDAKWADLNPNDVPATKFGKVPAACEAPLATDIAVAAGPTPAGCRCVQQRQCAPVIAGATLMPTPPPGNPTGCMCVDLVTNATGLAPADGICDPDPVTGLPQPVWATVPPLYACGQTIYKPIWEPVTSGPYVWHCHIVDHEDNEMMRPLVVVP